MMTYVLHILFVAGLVYWSYLKVDKNELQYLFLPSLLIKVIAGIAVGVLYKWYYGYGDTLLYFEDAKTVSNLIYNNWGNYFDFIFNKYELQLHYEDNPRALFFVKMISLIVFFTNSNYWLTSIYLSITSFYACWYFVTTIKKYYPNILMGAVVGLLFFPSIVFWSSGVIKESISLALIVLLAAYFIQSIHSDTNWVKNIIGALLMVLLFNLKYYYLTAFVFAMAPTLILTFFCSKVKVPVRFEIILWFVFLVFVGLGVSFLHPNTYIDRFMEVVVENNKLYENHVDLANTIQYYNLNDSVWSIILNAPIAIFSIWFRPWLFEATSWLQIALGLENIILMFFLFVWVSKNYNSKHKIRPILLSCIVYVIILSIFLALTTPNFGTLSRYRISFLPFFIMIISYNSPFFKKVNDILILNFTTRKT